MRRRKINQTNGGEQKNGFHRENQKGFPTGYIHNRRCGNLGSRVLGVDLDRDLIFNEMNRLFAIERIGFGITRAR